MTKRWSLAVLAALAAALVMQATLAQQPEVPPIAGSETSHASDATANGEATPEHGMEEPVEATTEQVVAEGSAQAEHAEQVAHGGHHGPELGKLMGLLWVLPFVGILLSIALGPLLAPNVWHHHYPKASVFWALCFAVPALWIYGQSALHEIVHIYLIDYIPFIILLWGLFTVAGGIVVRGSLRGTPLVNTIMLLIGTALASWVGTTGAAMVMIRPLLRANASRKNKVHLVVFFIFLVANIGGALTPLGDPPLFLGFLHSVPFFWTLILIKPQALVVTLLLITFFVIDTIASKKDPAAPMKGEVQKFGIGGAHNFLFLAGIVGLVLMSGTWRPGEFSIMGIGVAYQNLARAAGIICMGLLSLWLTKKQLRRENDFSWEPILEVAYLFAGIFMTIVPALAILKAGSEGALSGLVAVANDPWQYFWITGSLSSFLDNAPTYLTFFNTALGKFYPGLPEASAVAKLIADNEIYLEAISSGAVFMGACTYIGNAPNFMVKSIAEEQGIEMPSFFGYILRWTIPILLPCFVIVTLLFYV